MTTEQGRGVLVELGLLNRMVVEHCLSYTVIIDLQTISRLLPFALMAALLQLPAILRSTVETDQKTIILSQTRQERPGLASLSGIAAPVQPVCRQMLCEQLARAAGRR